MQYFIYINDIVHFHIHCFIFFCSNLLLCLPYNECFLMEFIWRLEFSLVVVGVVFAYCRCVLVHCLSCLIVTNNKFGLNDEIVQMLFCTFS